MRKNCSSDREKIKFETEGREFAKCLRSQEQFIQIVKEQYNLETECFFNLFQEVSQILSLRQSEFHLKKIIIEI